jgi:hypothetical protein
MDRRDFLISLAAGAATPILSVAPASAAVNNFATNRFDFSSRMFQLGAEFKYTCEIGSLQNARDCGERSPAGRDF